MSKLVNDILVDKDIDTCYRKIGNRIRESTLACGFLRKRPTESNYNISLDFYGGLYLLEGEGIYSDQHETHKINAGDFIQRLPNNVHTTTVLEDKEWIEFFICINTSTYHNLFDMGLLSGCPVLKGPIPNDIVEHFPIFLEKMKSASDEELPSIFFEAQELLVKITKACSEEKMKPNSISECVTILDNTYGRISGPELADSLFVSYESLRKNFYKTMGISISKYGILTRLSHAKESLENTDLTLSQIAMKYGYSDYFSFCKQFKEYNFITPKEYRERFRIYKK